MTNSTTTDASVINSAVESLEEPQKVEVKTVAPPETEVTLPGGFITGEGSLVKYAEVRELNGMDEEAISKSGSIGRAMNLMLQRGVVSIGMDKVSKEEVDQLLSGDRDALLIGIRKITFGSEVDYHVICPSCSEELDVKVDLNKDVPYVTLDDPINDRVFTYTTRKGEEVVVKLPTGSTQKKLFESADKTVSELNTILLAGCVESVNGFPSVGTAAALKLGMVDRENLVAEILKRNPGPRLGEVTTTCAACGKEIPMPLSLADLFRL